MELKKGDLGFLGLEFQYRLVHHFMDDKKFFTDMYGIIDNNMFTEPNLKKFVGTLLDYYHEYGSVPSYDLMSIELRSTCKKEQDYEFVDATIDKIKNTTTEGYISIKKKAQRFFKQQNFIKFTNKITELLKIGDLDNFEELQELWEQALTAGNRDEIGISLRDNLGDVLSEEYRHPIPTGISGIDKVLEGGLGKGELGVIIGPSSFGKTSMTTGIANFTARNGYKTVQIVFEDKERQIQRKHIGRITNIEAKDISKEENIEYVKEVIQNTDVFDENLIIKKFNTGEVTPVQIKNYLTRLINTGFKPDVVIIDYFECLVPSKNFKDQWQAEGHMMRQLESYASELDIALWVPTQGTKDSLNADIVTMDKAGGSFKKIQIAHVVISIARSVEDIERNIATIALLKNRAGKSGVVMEGVYFNNGTCEIRTQDSNVKEYTQFKKDEEVKKQALAGELLKERRSKNETNKKEIKSNEDEPF